MDNKELLKQLKDCLEVCDKLAEEKEGLEKELEEQIKISDELEGLLKEANKSMADTVDTISNIYNSVEEFRKNVMVYKNYVLALMDDLYDKVVLINENEEIREKELIGLKEDVEKIRKEIIELNKDLD